MGGLESLEELIAGSCSGDSDLVVPEEVISGAGEASRDQLMLTRFSSRTINSSSPKRLRSNESFCG